MSSSLYHQHIDGTSHHKRVRPVVVGAPYLLCAFAVGVILMAVGTFITSHAYDDEKRDPVLLGVGPGLIGLGGLLLLCAVLMCVVACLRNRSLRNTFSDDFFTIGASTFYGDNELLSLDDENNLYYQSSSRRRRHSTSGGASDPNEGIIILANTLEEERHRQRKNSRKAPRNQSYESGSRAYYTGPQGLASERSTREDPDFLGREPIRRALPLPELPQDYGLSESDDSGYMPRDRSYSMSVRRPGSRLAPVEQRLRRNLTYTQASRARLQQQQRHHQRQQASQPMPGLETPPWPQRRRSSKRKKPQSAINEVQDVPTVHQLPRYDPNLLHALGLGPTRPRPDRGISEDGLLASGTQPATWWEDPDVTHGSLENPRRRPSVKMGLRGMRPKLAGAGAAYRYSSSIYASDMDLHRTDASVTSDASQARQDPYPLQSQGGSNHHLSQPESSLVNHSHESSPTPLPPYGYGDTSPQLDTRRENTPPSMPTQRQRRRPLSNISSASESCCSECCEGHQEGVSGEPGEPRQHNHRPDHAHQRDTDHDTDQRSRDNDA
ncbi:hypothetical protein GWK47_044920 [Chionoecetes opilio]|uniref:Uncharacterized protein n=1 Tax=Chionoecetes opilio TaxID=41210 RepID=A0A8J4YDG8_CHIOP|nr:hypothetical protein GWK47_044920 [Chionoecetes opilio]